MNRGAAEIISVHRVAINLIVRASSPREPSAAKAARKGDWFYSITARLKPCPDSLLSQYYATPNRETHARTNRSQCSGFTLLELLVSITLVSLLVTTVLFGWRIAASAWAKASSRLEEERTILSTHLLLQEQMASMVPQQAWGERGMREFFFQGEPQAVRFVSRYSLAHRAGSGLYLIEYQIAKQPDGTEQLLLNESPVNSNQDLGKLIAGVEAIPGGKKLQFTAFEQEVQTVRLLQGMQEIRFEYFRAASFFQPGAWTDQWLNFNDELPRAIAIRAVSRSASGASQPVSIVAAVRDFARPPLQ